MPVKITSITDPESGEISPEVLSTMKASYINQVDLTPVNGRAHIVKKHSVAVMKDELIKLIRHYESGEGIDVVRFNIAVHPSDPQLACNEEDFSNSLTVVVEAEKFVDIEDHQKGTTPYNNPGDFVVIPGFCSFPPPNQIQGDKPCCPSSKP